MLGNKHPMQIKFNMKIRKLIYENMGSKRQTSWKTEDATTFIRTIWSGTGGGGGGWYDNVSLAVPLQNSDAELFQALNRSHLENRAEAKHLSDIGKSNETADWNVNTLRKSFISKEREHILQICTKNSYSFHQFLVIDLNNLTCCLSLMPSA